MTMPHPSCSPGVRTFDGGGERTIARGLTLDPPSRFDIDPGLLQWLMLMAKSLLLLGGCVLQVVAGLCTTTASTVVQASTSSTSGATALTVPESLARYTDSSPPSPPLPPLPPRDIPLYPPIPQPPAQGPSPFLPVIGIFILMLAFLGFASTIIALPFHLSPSTVPHPSSGGEGKSGTEAKVKVPSSTPTIRLGTWMTFFLVICLGLVVVQGRFGLGLGSWRQAGYPVGTLNLVPLVPEGQVPLVGVGVGVPVHAPQWGHNVPAGRGAVAPVVPAQQRLDYVLRGRQQLVDAQALPFTNIRPQEVSCESNVPPPSTANLESFFYPLLVGAIALLAIFDYAS